MNRNSRRIRTLTLAVALAAGLSGLLASSALADGPKVKGRGHAHHERQHSRGRVVMRVADRPATWHVRAGWTWTSSSVPFGCEESNYVVLDDEPFFRHVGLGVWIGGANLDVQLTNAPAAGYGYQDPYRGTWISDVRAYSTWCERNHRRAVVRVVRLEDRCSR